MSILYPPGGYAIHAQRWTEGCSPGSLRGEIPAGIVAHPDLFYSAWWPQMAVLEWAPRLFQVTTSKQPDSRMHYLDYPEDDLTSPVRVRLRPGGEARGGRIFVPPERAAPISRSSGIRLASSCDLLPGGRGDRASRRRRRRPLASARLVRLKGGAPAALAIALHLVGKT